MVKKAIQSVKTWSGLQIPKIRCYYLHNPFPDVFLFYFHHSNLTSLFGFFNIKYLSNANFTVDIMRFFAIFVLIFMSAHAAFSIIYQLGEFK